MAAPTLQHHLIQPVLCHSLPPKPTCLAYDSVNNLLAIGCDSGKFLILSSSQRELKEYDHHGEKKCVRLLSFNTQQLTQGKEKNEHQSYLLTSLAGQTKIVLWTVNGLSLGRTGYYELDEVPSVLEWSPVSSKQCYIGTEAGNVQIVEVKQTNIIHDIKSELKHKGHKNHGKVITVLQKSIGQLIVIYSSGICILWDKKRKIVDHAKITDEMPIAAWLPSQDTNSMIVGCSNGQLFDFDCKAKDTLKKKDDHRSFRVSESGTSAPILKLQHRHQDKAEWLAYCESNALYIQVQKDGSNLKPSQELYNNTVNKVVDIKFLSQDAATAELAVLTETELLLYAKETKSQIYQHFSQSHNYPYIASPVTCLQHCRLCTKEFLEAYLPKVRNAPVELIATGHDDGSFRLWGCSYENQVLSFEIARLVYTAQYFNQLEKPMQAITLIKLDHKQGNLLIVNKCNRVLVFSCEKQGRAQAVSQPQSHEIILKDYKDKTPSRKALETPSPHFSPPSPNLPLQLLQHFSCFYHKAQNNETMDTVSVNCVEYNGEIGMLAVGTERGLVVLDTHMNMLIQVIGSDNKLIKICTKDTNTKIGDKNSCDVKCLETTNMFLDKEDPIRRLTLWVGTKSGVIACLVIARDGEEPLQLRNTGIFRKSVEGGSINGIQFYEVSASEGEQSTVHTNVLVSTKDYITVIKCPEIGSSKDPIKKITGGVMKSGLFKLKDSPSEDPTHFVSLTKKGTQFLVHELQDQGLGKEDLSPISGTSAALFSSSGGSHCVIKFTDSRGPQLMYFQNKLT